MRARRAEPDGDLIDGQFMRVAVQGDTPEEKIVVPQAALLADQDGIYVFVVEDGKAVVQRVKTGGEVGTDVAVEQGLTGGEQVIVDGPAEPAPRSTGCRYADARSDYRHALRRGLSR